MDIKSQKSGRKEKDQMQGAEFFVNQKNVCRIRILINSQGSKLQESPNLQKEKRLRHNKS